MAQTVADPEPICATKDEQAVLQKVEQFIEHAAGAGQTLPRLVDPDGNTVELPPSVLRVLYAAVHQLAQGQTVTLIPSDKELTTQQAADLLNISRPYLVKLLEQGEIPYAKTGTHRRVRFAELMDYKARRERQRAEALTELTQLSQAIGLYDE